MKRDQASDDVRDQGLFPIVGIGASAGGLHSLECFLEVLPAEFGFAVVFLQHLSPAHKSLMPELLRSKRRDIEMVEIRDGLELFPGKLYLCPPAMEVRVHRGVFRVIPRPKEHVHFPIDEFLVSLAEDAAERAVAVIFSGAGTDGVRGAQAIRTEGGTVFVQEPGTAQYPELPLAAINAGTVDEVLPPADIAREILRFQRSGAVTEAPDGLIAPAHLEPFFLLVHEKTGHRFNYYKKSVVSRRIRRRMYLHGVSSVNEYLKIVSDREGEAALLASDLMIGVTSFFRDPLAWKALRIGVIRKLAAEEDDVPIRIWTPACATGEEAYSIAVMLRRELDLAGRKREFQVFATDVNDRALDRAREGTYHAGISADVPQEYMKKYFTRSEDGLSVTIRKEIRQYVTIAKQDILTDPPFSRLDLIICRNLMIYLEPDAQEKCLTLFHYALKPGGYLFLGNAESPGRNSTLFRSLAHKKCRVYQKIEAEHSSRLPLSVPFAAGRPASALSKLSLSAEQAQSAIQIIQESLLNEYAPAAVAINQSYDILYHNGPTNRYLTQPRGAPAQNLLDLISETLRSRIRGALYRATQEERPVSIRGAIADDKGRKRQVSIRVSKVKDNLFLVVFREKGELPSQPAAPDSPAEAECVEEPAVRQLESELSATRQELRGNIEQLKGLNEELQSSNEELQAANEELETSREELQSLNEELITVNSQLQSKVEEQEETNNDLNNFLSSSNIPTVFLDHQFRVKRFTPAMTRLIKLIPSDIGRPIIDLSQETLGPDLIADARNVLDNLTPVKKEIKVDDTWYIRNVLPYRTSDNRIEGVVITYNDVTELKRVEEHTRHLASFPQLDPNPVIEVDASGRISFANPASLRNLESLGMEKKDVTAFLPSDFDAVLKGLEDESESTLYREVSIGDRVFGESVFVAPLFGVVRIYAYDITERKKAQEALEDREARLRRQLSEIEAIYGSAHVGLCAFDRDLRYLRINDRLAEINGIPVAEHLGKTVREVVPSLADMAEDIARRILKTGQPVTDIEFSGEMKSQPGVQRYWTEHWLPLKDGQGTVIGINVVVEEITERKRAEERIIRAKEEWERTFDSVPDLIAIMDNRHRVRRVNQAMAKRLGLTPEQCIGLPCHEAVHGSSVPPAFCPHSRTMRDGCDHVEEVHEDRLGGDFMVSTSPLYDERGEMIGSVHVAHDITVRKKADEQIRRNMEELRAMNEELARFNRAAVGRELRMLELKKEINALCEAAGLPARYRVDFGEETKHPPSA